MVLRHRKPTNVQETVQNVVQELDAFVKVEEHYVEQSVLGAVGEIYKLPTSFLILCNFNIRPDTYLFNFITLFFSLYRDLDSRHSPDIHRILVLFQS